MIDELVNRIYKNDFGGTFLLGITGFQGAGKSTLIDNLGKYLGSRGMGIETVSSDLYHKLSRQDKRELFKKRKDEGKKLLDIILEAYAHDTSLMRNHLERLKRGMHVCESGLYDNKTGEKNATLEISLAKKPTLVVIEGVYILQEGAGEFLDETVFIHATKEERLRRTIERQSTRLGAHKIDLDAFEAMDEANKLWICPHLKKPYIIVENNDPSNPSFKVAE